MNSKCIDDFIIFDREGHYSVAKLILDSKAEVNVPSGSENNIPLTLACWKGRDRKSVVQGKSVDLGGRRIIKKKKKQKKKKKKEKKKKEDDY